MCVAVQGSADSNYSQHSSDLSLEEDSESRHRENERHALAMLEKARVCIIIIIIININEKINVAFSRRTARTRNSIFSTIIQLSYSQPPPLSTR